jgi:hypothetical protein
MRELHTFNDEQQANLLVGVLQSQAMPAEVTPEENAWVVWVLNDDDRDQARAVLADFQQDPAAPKFQAAAKLWKHERALNSGRQKNRSGNCKYAFRIAGPVSGGSRIRQP